MFSPSHYDPEIDVSEMEQTQFLYVVTLNGTDTIAVGHWLGGLTKLYRHYGKPSSLYAIACTDREVLERLQLDESSLYPKSYFEEVVRVMESHTVTLQ